jgi:type I restriction enzyme S subunit
MKLKSIGELCDLRNGLGFSAKEWSTSGLPIIRIQNLNGSTEFNYFSGDPDEKWVVYPGDILFSWAGTKGVSFGAFRWNGPRGVLNQHIFKVIPKPGVDPEWLFPALRVVTERIEKKAHGFKATLLHVKKGDIVNQRIQFPDKDEQRSVARIVSAISKSVEICEGRLVRTRIRRQALMQQLLTGKRRFPGFGKPWKKVAIAQFLTESRIPGSGGDTARKITVKLYGKGVVAKEDRLMGSVNTRYYKRKAGQFIYSKLDFLNGAFGIIPSGLDGYESTLDLPCFDFTGDIDPIFFLNIVSSERFYLQHLGLANGGRKARRVNPDDLLNCEILVPEPREQAHIVESIILCDREITIIERLLAAYQRQKRALMQQLLTGKRRVKTCESTH